MDNIIKIKREQYLEDIRPFYDSQYIKVITGIRRCGKSEILKQIVEEIISNGVLPEHIIKIDLENKKFINFKTGTKIFKFIDRQIKDKDKYYIFIDEIQHIKHFEEVVAAIRTSYNCSLFITGSNSRLLKGKLQDRLVGRAKEFEIMPFTYLEVKEYERVNNIKTSDFNEFLKLGGMPQRFEESNEHGVFKYLYDLFISIVQKDVFGIHKRINQNRFIHIAKYIVANSSKEFSALSIAKYLKNELKIKNVRSLAKNINEYADKIIECYFVKECYPYDFSTKRTIKGMRKFYCVDNGLRSCLGNPVEPDLTFGLENLIYNELKYRGYQVYYGQARQNNIDFVVVKNNKKCLIQVCYLINNKETYEREYGAYKTIKDNSPKYVMSLDKVDTSNNGITHLNIIDFLEHKTDIVLS